MRLTILMLLLTVGGTIAAQTHEFKPKWDKGTEKVLSMVQVEREYENDELISDTTVYNEAIVRVIDESKSEYTLEVTYENQALRASIELYDKMGEELKDYRDLKLLFSLNKETAETELLNWEETQEFMNESFDQMTSVLEKKTPEMAPYVGLIFMPIKEIFKSKENVEAYMLDNIGFILVPFQHQFRLNEAISTTDSQESPFNPMQELSATTIVTLKSFDKSSGDCVIELEVQLDLSQFIEMMKEMMKSMAESLGADEKSTEEKVEEMNEFEMDVTDIQTIYFNSNSTWVERAVSTGLVTGTNPRDRTRTKKEIVSTTTLK